MAEPEESDIDFHRRLEDLSFEEIPLGEGILLEEESLDDVADTFLLYSMPNASIKVRHLDHLPPFFLNRANNVVREGGRIERRGASSGKSALGASSEWPMRPTRVRFFTICGCPQTSTS